MILVLLFASLQKNCLALRVSVRYLQRSPRKSGVSLLLAMFWYPSTAIIPHGDKKKEKANTSHQCSEVHRLNGSFQPVTALLHLGGIRPSLGWLFEFWCLFNNCGFFHLFVLHLPLETKECLHSNLMLSFLSWVHRIIIVPSMDVY